MQASNRDELALQPCDRHVRPPCETVGDGGGEKFHCMKNSRWRLNFLRRERSHEKLSPALQAIWKVELNSEVLFLGYRGLHEKERLPWQDVSISSKR